MKTPLTEIRKNLHTMNAFEFNEWIMKNIDELVEIEKQQIIDSFNAGINEMAGSDWWGGTTKINGNSYYDNLNG